MPTARTSRASAYEYRHKYTVLPRRDLLAGNPDDRDAAFVDDLIASIDGLDRGQGEGWQVVRVKVYEDTGGRQWVHAYLKRQLASVAFSPCLDDQVERSRSRAA